MLLGLGVVSALGPAAGEGGKQHGRKGFFPSGDAQMGQPEGFLQTIFSLDGDEEQRASRGWGRPWAGALWDMPSHGSPGGFQLLQSLFPRQLKRVWSSSGWRQRCYPLLYRAFGGSLGLVGLLSAQDCAVGSEGGLYWLQSWSLVLTGSKVLVKWGRVQALYHPLLQHSLNPLSPKSFLLFLALCDFVDNRPGHRVVVVVMEGDGVGG